MPLHRLGLAALVALLAAPAAADGPAPLTLDEALAEAARASADARRARLDVDRAGADRQASWAGVLPRLDLQASTGRDFYGARSSVLPYAVSLDPLVFDQQTVQLPASDAGDHSLGLTLRVPLFDGLRSWNAIRQAEATERAAARGYDEQALVVAAETTRRFLEVVRAQETLRVLQETAARSARIVESAQALFEAGRGGRLEVLTARGNLGADRIAVTRAVARLAQARADLGAWLGREDGEGPAVVPPASVLGPAPAPEPPAATALVALARQRRPLLASRAEAERAAGLGEDVARGAWWPELALEGSYTRQGPDLTGSDGVWGDPGRQYTATALLTARWNLYEGGRTAAGQRRAAVDAARARADGDAARAQVAAEVARARAALVAAGDAAALAQDDLALAEQGLAVARERLLAGVASQIEVRDASLKLTQAQLDLSSARIDQAIARADLARAAGGPLPEAPGLSAPPAPAPRIP